MPAVVGPTRKIGRYALYTEIAAGGLATVHIGRLLGPVGFARTVAIKQLHPQFAKDPDFVASFLDEARLASRIRHPNVVPTLDVVAIDGELFLVMEFVIGESLAQLLRLASEAQEPVPAPIAIAIMVGVLHGLHAAHEARDEHGEPLGIVHRDISPHNILVGADGVPHLIDFGIAKARGRSQTTRDGQIKGKLAYMPPEQLLGNPIDRRADIFAASIVLWEMLTGRRLFQGLDDRDVLARVLHAPIQSPSAHAPGLSGVGGIPRIPRINPAVDSVVLRGLARDRVGRYATAREMALTLEAIAPLAPPSRVGSWVEALAHETLAQRASQVSDVEHDASSEGEAARSEPAALLGTVSSRSAVSPASGWGESLAGESSSARRRRHGRSLILLSAALTAIAMIGGVIAWRGHRAALGAAATGNASATATRPVDPPPLLSTPLSRPAAAVTDLPNAANAWSTGSAAETRAPPNHRSMQQASSSSRPDATVRAAPSIAPAGASCNPPFWYDAEGNKRYYRQCAGL